MDLGVLASRIERLRDFGKAIGPVESTMESDRATFDGDAAPIPRFRILAITIAVAVGVGALAGVCWALLAPAEHLVVLAPGRGAPSTGESLHRFDSVAIFLCITLVAGILLPVGFWTWTERRGPAMALGLVLGSFLGSATTLGLGVWMSGILHSRPDDPAVGSVVARAAGMESPLVLIVQALATSFVVLLLAAMNPHDNLRFTLDDEESEPRANSAAEGRAPGPLWNDEHSDLTGRA